MPRSVLALSALALCAACNHQSSEKVELSEARVATVFSAPSGVQCIELVATSPSKMTSKLFGVSSGQSTTSLSLTGVPTGNVMFSGLAFNDPCAFISGNSAASWVADDVTVHVNAGNTAQVQLTFHSSASAIVSGDFAGDDYTVTTIAGVGGTQWTAAGPASLFAGPNDLALSADGRTLYVGDRNDTPVIGAGMAIRAVDTTTGAVTTLAGSLSATGTDDGPGTSARFSRLFGMALSGSNLLIADRCAIRSMSTISPYTVTTLVGTRRAANPAQWDCSPATTPLGNQDLDIVVRGSNVYIADATHFVIHQVAFAFSPPVITTYAGTTDVAGTTDGTLFTAQFIGPTSVVFPFVGDDIFYVVESGFTGDTSWGLVRRGTVSGNSVDTVAGGAQSSAAIMSADGLGTGALFAQPRRAVSDGRSLFIGDAWSVRRMDLATSAVVTLAGSDTDAGFADGVGRAARFNAAFGVARDPVRGAIYIGDQGNFAIRKLTPP